MSEIQRYDVDGEWVKWEYVEKLEAENKALLLYRKGYKKLKMRFNIEIGIWPPQGASYTMNSVDTVLEIENQELTKALDVYADEENWYNDESLTNLKTFCGEGINGYDIAQEATKDLNQSKWTQTLQDEIKGYRATLEKIRVNVRVQGCHVLADSALHLPAAETLKAIEPGPQEGDKSFDTTKDLLDDLGIGKAGGD